MLTLSIILFSGSLSPDDNQEKIMWGDEKYCLEFKYLNETQPILIKNLAGVMLLNLYWSR